MNSTVFSNFCFDLKRIVETLSAPVDKVNEGNLELEVIWQVTCILDAFALVFST